MAFRSLSRPSSALDAKASSLCSSSLDLVFYTSSSLRFALSLTYSKIVWFFTLFTLKVCFCLFVLVFFAYYVVFNVLFGSCDPWWGQVDSNYRPRAYQARALTC